MKTKNNVQKTILRSVAVVVSFVLISLTVSGQDFWKKLLENSSFNEIALAMVGTSNDKANLATTTTDLNFTMVEDDLEPTLEMEDWMVNSKYFEIGSIEITEVPEINLELEDWMLDEELFQVKSMDELPLKLEAWMTSEKVWEV